MTMHPTDTTLVLMTSECGKGWSEKQLWHCLRVAESFPDEAILSIEIARQRLVQGDVVGDGVLL